MLSTEMSMRSPDIRRNPVNGTKPTTGTPPISRLRCLSDVFCLSMRLKSHIAACTLRKALAKKALYVKPWGTASAYT
mgnify:CR=1 FL=1